MEYIKKNLGSYTLHLIKNTNFKSVMVKVFFREPIKKEKITIHNFLTTMLTFSSKKYPSKREMVLKTQDLYSCSIGSSDSRLGNYLNTSFRLSVLKDKYTETGNLEKAIEFLSEIIYNPNVENNKFDEKSFDIIMNQACLALSSIKEDASSYSVIRMFENMDSTSPISYRSFGYLEDLKDINRSNLYNYYKEMLKNDDMDIFVIGDINFEEIDPIIRKYFKQKRFKKTKGDFLIPDKKPSLKKNIVTEDNDSTQSKLAIGCRTYNLTDYERNYPLTLYNIILGGGPDSKLFSEVREKNSLCYYIGSTANKLDNTLLIRAGISRNDFKKAIKIIEKQMTDLAKGNFTDEDVEKAKELYQTAIDEMKESEAEIISSYYMIELLGVDDIETKAKKMREVNKKEIIKVAKKIKIDTIYMLEGVQE